MPVFRVRSERSLAPERKLRVRTPYWVDMYFALPGSSIEKMVLAELVRRGIFFIFRAQTNDLGGFVDPTWEADFLLPQHKIWIEVQGSYFHSLPGQIENDSMRYAAIEMAGWQPHFLWEFDIRARLPDLLDQIGAFYMVNSQAEASARSTFSMSDIYQSIPYENFAVGRDLTDQLKGLRAALANRRKPVQLRVVRRTRRRPK